MALRKRVGNMNEDHTFPLPSTVTHQLEELGEEFDQRPLHVKAHDFARTYPWHLVLAAVAVGLIAGFVTRRRC